MSETSIKNINNFNNFSKSDYFNGTRKLSPERLFFNNKYFNFDVKNGI